jgi:ubiquinone/menaquinone biosynthesis C-methylase UbiE
MDVTDIQSPDDSFDIVYCSHVLEHVDDDRRAMRELCRVLRPDGWAILMVPITTDRTVEDPSISDPQERLRLFGQKDHVRRYGPDFVDRLREAGFAVETIRPDDFLSPEEIERMAIDRKYAGEIYHCTKNAAASPSQNAKSTRP